MIKRLLRKIAGIMDFAVFNARGRYCQDGLFTVHSDHFRLDPRFRNAYERGMRAANGIDPMCEWRLHVTLWVARNAARADGDFVECGVNAGFVSSAIMATLHWNTVGKRFHLIDTFTGPALNQYSQEEIRSGSMARAQRALDAGAYVTDVDRVHMNFGEWANVIIVQGPIPEVLAKTGIGKVAFLHIDMNCAAPERAAFEFFWDRLSPGSMVLLDDFGYCGHDYQRETTDAVARAKGAEVLYLPTGTGLGAQVNKPDFRRPVEPERLRSTVAEPRSLVAKTASGCESPSGNSGIGSSDETSVSMTLVML